ncbi:hypothetical protein [Peribacillus sp. NPDC056705]|uniref:hypothetical protein n=1 Tax=Peribacillus sp. NPDC056705 TaxID=3345918 RepID=UPI0037497206
MSRDWQKDMERVKQFEHAKTLHNNPSYYQEIDYEPVEVALGYWLKQYSTEKKSVTELQQALDLPKIHLWYELMNERTKHRSARESVRLLHTVYGEQCARASEYYNEMVAERERADKAEKREEELKVWMIWAINESGWGDPENTLEKISNRLKNTLSSLYPKEEME